jgi:Membrane bound O-acyl transferase family
MFKFERVQMEGEVMESAAFLTDFLFYWLLIGACCGIVSNRKCRSVLAIVFPSLFTAALACGFNALETWQRLWLGTIGLLFTIKASILLLRLHSDMRSFSKIGLLIYMSLWPGMDPQPFVGRVQCLEDGKRFVRGYICFWLGLLCFIISSIAALSPTVTNWLCLAGLLLMLHFGYADMLSCVLRLAGWDVKPLFDAPLLSGSLQDFWSRRWNLAFVEMDKILFLPLARRLFNPRGAILFVFVISGLLHEIGISYASGQLWGLPLLYFLIQGIGIIIEKQWLSKKTLSPAATRTFAMVWVLAPLALLFNAPFQSAFVAPLSSAVGRLTGNLTVYWLLSQALWLAAAGHFSTLIAGLQVPFRLHWQEELSRLSSFNRKILLYCAAFVGLMIIAFGCLTLALHDQFLMGDKCAVFLALLIALFWIARLVVDWFYFHHSDWPKGPEFVIGHACLNTLFLFLASVYSSVVLLHWPSLLSNPMPLPASLQAEKTLLLIAALLHGTGQWVGQGVGNLTTHWLLSQVLWLAAIGNLCALIAGVQVPFLLHWREELSRLSNFNRKIMINYACYVFTIIMAFGFLTFVLHDQLLIGDKSAVSLALVMALFWILRLMVDCFYFRHSDWPKGVEFAMAHSLLTGLFLFLAAVYSFIVLLNWWLPSLLLR